MSIKTISLILLSVILFAFPVYTSVEADLVKDLPEYPYKGPMYSGYLKSVSPGRNLHYLFLPSQKHPETDPVVIWFNGGPGCSSLLGFIQEHGPAYIPDYESKFEMNPYSWNNNANMLYIESPAGVGFSTNDNGTQDLIYDDQKSGMDNLYAVVNFFNKFPEFAKNDLYISGESYAGVYVPVLADLILKNKHRFPLNLKGIIVGNGLTDLEFDIEKALVDFAYEHALYSDQTREKYLKECDNFTNVTPACNEARREIRAAMQGNNIYDIYRECPPSESEDQGPHQATSNFMNRVSVYQRFKFNTFTSSFRLLEKAEGIWPDGCKEDPYPTQWFNKAEVKKALHVREDITYVQCNGFINENYVWSDQASLPIYPRLMEAGLRVWFYAGDTDAAVSFNGSVKWIHKLNLPIVEKYRPWSLNGQTVGYVQSYQGMDFITILGTGHMAPQWKRAESYKMFNSFLRGDRLN